MRYCPHLPQLGRLLTAMMLAGALLAPAAAGQDFAAATRPELALHAISGEEVSLSALQGNVVVVNFWATWCIPCREELPLLESLSREYVRDGVRFVAVSTDDESTRDGIPAAVDEAGITFDVWTDATTVDMKRFGLGTELPATAVVARDGTVVARMFGVVSEADLRKQIDRAIDAPPDGTIVAADVRTDADSCCDDEEGCDHSATADESHAHDHDHDGEDAHGDADAAVTEENASLVPS